MRIASADRMMYALGVDVTAAVPVAPHDPDAVGWYTLFSGFEFVPVSEAVHAIWDQAHARPVSMDALVEALADDPDRDDAIRLLTRDHPVFVPWPWVNSSTPLLSATELFLVTSAQLPNPAPHTIPDALWHHCPSLAELEDVAGGAPARWRLMEDLPDWLAALPGLRLQLKLPPWLRMMVAGIDPATGIAGDRDTLLRRYGVDPEALTRRGDGA